MKRAFGSISPTRAEVNAHRVGDDIVPTPGAVMDRAFYLDASPERVWPWLVQLGKQRAGWYLPRSVERFIPRAHRAIRTLDARWQGLAVGDVVPDYGGCHETFGVAHIDPPRTLVYVSKRGRMQVSWSITLTSACERESASSTRVHLRLRIGPIRRVWFVNTVGELVDALTIAGMAAGLRERLTVRE